MATLRGRCPQIHKWIHPPYTDSSSINGSILRGRAQHLRALLLLRLALHRVAERRGDVCKVAPEQRGPHFGHLLARARGRASVRPASELLGLFEGKTQRRGEEEAALPPPRTKWTRRVPHPVLIGRAPLGTTGAWLCAPSHAKKTRRLTAGCLGAGRDDARRAGELHRRVPPPPPPYCCPYPCPYCTLTPSLPSRCFQGHGRGRRDARRAAPPPLLRGAVPARRSRGRPPTPLPRTNRTSLVPLLVLSGHAVT